MADINLTQAEVDSLITMEQEVSIPEQIEDILKWLANKEAERQHDG